MAQIMIVEDNQGTNKAICEYLKTAGHTLFPALDGEEALNIFRDNSIDLAVLDIMLSNHSWQTGSCGQAKCHTASWHRQKYSRTSRS